MRPEDCFHIAEQSASRDLFISVKYKENDEEIKQPPRFAHYKTVADLPVNRIFLRDPHRTHYHQGLPSIGSDVYAITDAIADFIRTRKIERTVIIGTSAGGYMALLLGKLLEKRFPALSLRVHTWDPQTVLRYDQEKEKLPYQWGYIPGPTPTPELMDLVPVFKELPARRDQRYMVNLGTGWEDHEHARRLSELRRSAPTGNRRRAPVVVKRSRAKECPHGKMIVRQSKSGRLRSLIFSEFGLVA